MTTSTITSSEETEITPTPPLKNKKDVTDRQMDRTEFHSRETGRGRRKKKERKRMSGGEKKKKKERRKNRMRSSWLQLTDTLEELPGVFVP